jgi:uncharacterized protein (UPF0332 family)
VSPASQGHLDQARRNRALAEELLAHPSGDSTHVQWAVTAAFYCALHCLQAYLLDLGRDPQSHAARGREIADPANRVPMDVQLAYVALEQLSKKARYRLGVFAPSFVRRRVLDDRLRKVTDFVGL